MPRLLDAVAKEIEFVTVFTMPEVRKLKLIMDIMELNYDGKNPTEVEAEQWLMKEFYPYVKGLLEEYDHVVGSDSP